MYRLIVKYYELGRQTRGIYAPLLLKVRKKKQKN